MFQIFGSSDILTTISILVMFSRRRSRKNPTKDINQQHKYNDHKKWIGKVSGNEEAIIEALAELGREPDTAKELEMIILKRSSEMLQETLRIAYEEEKALHKSNL